MNSTCTNCGWAKPKLPKDLEKPVHCALCDEDIPKKDLKEHKKKDEHLLKYDILNKIKNLSATDKDEKETLNKILKTLTPKYIKKEKNNNNTVE